MPRMAYSVTAHHPSERQARAYVAWLQGGHVRAVIAGGAESGTITLLDTPPGTTNPAEGSDPRSVEVRYIFPSRTALDRYLRDFAPALRSEGLARFGPETGTRFERTIGEIQD